jgi:hypothetical protein
VLQPTEDPRRTSDGTAGDAQVLVARLRTDGTFDPLFGPTDRHQAVRSDFSLSTRVHQPDGNGRRRRQRHGSPDTHVLVARLIVDEAPSAGSRPPNPAEPGQPVSSPQRRLDDPDGTIWLRWDPGDGDGRAEPPRATLRERGPSPQTLTVRDGYGPAQPPPLRDHRRRPDRRSAPGGSERVSRAIKRGLKRFKSIDRAAATEKGPRSAAARRAGKTPGSTPRDRSRREAKAAPASAECAGWSAVQVAEARIATLGS